MKRKASRAPGYEQPAKLSKEATKNTVTEELSKLKHETTVKKAPLEPLRLASFRQRKAPAWLSSYVTNSTTKEAPKPSMPKFPTLVPPSKRKLAEQTPKLDNTIKKATENSSSLTEHPPSLRRDSTLKLEDLSSPLAVKSKTIQKLPSKVSLTKNSTQILSSSNDNSIEVKSLENKTTDSSTIKPPATKQVTSNSLTKEKHPVKPAESSIQNLNVNQEEFSPNVVELCDTKDTSLLDTQHDKELTPPAEVGKPTMLEVVICISTSGAMREYLEVLQDKTREMVWRLQSLIPNLRIGVFAHTQGGIHDDKMANRSGVTDHNYIRTGGHSGTKWIDLGATYSQICAFVGSLEPEATVYPDYVQDNLEMALWKLQRCMTWSSCSYRTILMLGRGRPNTTSFYLQREHWRGWIRSALEISRKTEIPVIDWELEAKLLAQMGIHVFTVQASGPPNPADKEEDGGTTFFKRVAEITNGQHIKLPDASKLVDVLVGVFCACYGPDLLQEHRDTLRDENDGVVPTQLKDIFISLQLHSKRRSLSTVPAVIGDLTILKRQMEKSEANGTVSGSEEEMSGDEEEQLTEISTTEKTKNDAAASSKANKKISANKKLKTAKTLNSVKQGRVVKTTKKLDKNTKQLVKKAIKLKSSLKNKKDKESAKIKLPKTIKAKKVIKQDSGSDKITKSKTPKTNSANKLKLTSKGKATPKKTDITKAKSTQKKTPAKAKNVSLNKKLKTTPKSNTKGKKNTQGSSKKAATPKAVKKALLKMKKTKANSSKSKLLTKKCQNKKLRLQIRL
ncbi:uncharacterized protein LOC131951349 [Physella acuta]|uniref:uncharacterized protein LOC131951349 n=1 Tax=Physella acuta TaxID=109671 RepID=UPI0027DBDA98|nr:uncharacterized protein LOC131951349 [Physella acuta]